MSKIPTSSTVAIGALVVLTGANATPTRTLAGRVLDAATQAPVVGASITIGGATTTSDEDGQFSIRNAGSDPLIINRDGYMEMQYPGLAVATVSAEIQLRPKPLPAELYTSRGFIPFLCIIVEPQRLRVRHSCSATDLKNLTQQIIKHNPWNPYFGEAADRSGVLLARPSM